MTESAAPQLPPLVEFTPIQIGGADRVFDLLDLVAEAGGDRAAIVDGIRVGWFSDSASKYDDPDDQLIQQGKRAGNVVSGMRAAGLLTASTRSPELSEFGESIRALRSSPEAGVREIARFLLREGRGIELLEAVRTVRRRDGVVSKGAVDAELIFRGYNLSTHTGNVSKLRGWLTAAGVLDKQWTIDEELFTELAGVGAQEISDWRRLTPLQQNCVEVLRVRAEGNQTPITSPNFLELLRQRGISFDGGQVKRDIYKPLSDGGWIKHEVATGARGKGGTLEPTLKALQLDVDLINRLALGDLPAELQEQLGRPLQEILTDLRSTDGHTKGIALELLALRLASDCGLLPVDLRVRGVSTGGAEVDLVAEGAHLHFSRWLFQCKNQKATVGIEVLAKELGMATFLRAQVVVIVTTAVFARSVLEYARTAAETTSIQVVLIDGELIKRYAASGPPALRDELHNRAVEILTLKRPQRENVPTE